MERIVEHRFEWESLLGSSGQVFDRHSARGQRGDLDGDGDVDLADFAEFMTLFTGPIP